MAEASMGQDQSHDGNGSMPSHSDRQLVVLEGLVSDVKEYAKDLCSNVKLLFEKQARKNDRLLKRISSFPLVQRR